MALLTGVIIGNNVAPNLIYVTQDLPNSCVTVDDVSSQQPILITYPQLNQLPCLENLPQEAKDPFNFFQDNFNVAVRDKDVLGNTNMTIDNISIQEPILINYPQVTLPNIDKNLNDHLGLYNENFNFTFECNKDPTSTIISDVPLQQTLLTNPQENILSETENSARCALNTTLTESDNNIIPSKENNQSKSDTSPKYDFRFFLEPYSRVTDESEELTRVPGRLKKDGIPRFRKKTVFKCNLCEKSYLSQNVIKKHIAKYHPEINNKFPCKSCTKAFDSMKKLVLHGIDHWEPRSICPLCSAKSFVKFKNKSALKAHFLRCHVDFGPNSDVLPYQCRLCRKCFQKPSMLTRHLRVHTGEKPYVCNECGARFSQKNSIIQHKYIHTKERPYKCSLCSAAFCQPGHLRIHQHRLHSMTCECNERFYCIKCPKFFIDHKTLNRHYIKFHKEVTAAEMLNSLPKARVPVKSKKKQQKTNLIEMAFKSSRIASRTTRRKRKVTHDTLLNQKSPSNERMDTQECAISNPKPSTNDILQRNENCLFENTILNDFSKDLPYVIEPNNSEKIDYFITIDNSALQPGNGELTQPLLISNVGDPSSMNINNIDLNSLLAFSGNYFITSTDNNQIVKPKDICLTSAQNPAGNITITPNPMQTSQYFCTPPNLSVSLDNSQVGLVQNQMFLNNSQDKIYISQNENVTNFINYEKTCELNDVSDSQIKNINNEQSEQCLNSESAKIENDDTVNLGFSGKKLLNVASKKRKHSNPKNTVKKLNVKIDMLKLLIQSTNPNIDNKETEAEILNMLPKINENKLKAYKWPPLACKCAECPASFSKSSDLKRHERVHTKEKPFGCSQCLQKFSLKSTLKTHQKVHLNESKNVNHDNLKIQDKRKKEHSKQSKTSQHVYKIIHSRQSSPPS